MDPVVDSLLMAPPYVCLAMAFGLSYGMLGVMDLTIAVRFAAAAYGGWIGSMLFGLYPALDPAALFGALGGAMIVSVAAWSLLAPLARQQRALN